jgi:hypothetical protein
MAHENDVVIIYFEDKPAGFARIEDISPDVKKDWYNVTLLLLQIPLQTVTWILKDIYIDGAEFTMNEKRMRLELVECPPGHHVESDPPVEKDKGPEKDNSGKVISLADRKSN